MNSYDGTSARNSAVAGVSWMLLFKVVDRGLGFASTIILARLLVPADFGLVAMATSFIALLELLGAFSLVTVLIQRPNPGKAHFDAAWTMNIIAGAVIATLMVAFAWPLAAFYREPRLSLVICVLAIVLGAIFLLLPGAPFVVLWGIAVLHAVLAVNSAKQDARAKEIADAMRGKR